MHKSLTTFLKPLEREAELHFELLHIPAGGTMQAEQEEDLYYYVMRGIGMFEVGEHATAATQGRLLHAPEGMPHRFHRISRNVLIMVMPAKAVATNNDSYY